MRENAISETQNMPNLNPLRGSSFWKVKMTTHIVVCTYFTCFHLCSRDFKEFAIIKLCVDPVVKCLCLSIMWQSHMQDNRHFSEESEVKPHTA